MCAGVRACVRACVCVCVCVCTVCARLHRVFFVSRVQESGTAVYEQGDAADGVYVLLEGRATETVRRNDKQLVTRELRPGCVAGGLTSFVGITHRGNVSH